MVHLLHKAHMINKPYVFYENSGDLEAGWPNQLIKKRIVAAATNFPKISNSEIVGVLIDFQVWYHKKISLLNISCMFIS